MFYDKSDGKEWKKIRQRAEDEVAEFQEAFVDDSEDLDDEASSEDLEDTQYAFGIDMPEPKRKQSGWSPFSRDYEGAIIDNIWEFAEIVEGVDAVLWRKDEFNEWIHRPDYGNRHSKFGWEIFDPGVGRHSQGVYAMRPMQWESYVDQFSSAG